MTSDSPELAHPTILRLSLLLLGLPQIVVGVWALTDPEGWHARVGTPLGPFNEHLVWDVGAALTALGALLAGSLIHLRVRTVQLILTGWIVFALPHAVYHGLHTQWHALSSVLRLTGHVIYALLPLLLLAGLWDGMLFRRSTTSSIISARR